MRLGVDLGETADRIVNRGRGGSVEIFGSICEGNVMGVSSKSYYIMS